MGPVASCRIFNTEIEVVDALAEMGISMSELLKAVSDGEAARNSCTSNDPAGAGGYFSFARTIRSLRESKIPQGWKRGTYKNLDTVYWPEGDLAIAVSSGNESTGDAQRSPKTKYPKGSATGDFLRDNRQLCLGPEFEPHEAPGVLESSSRHTWLLMRRVTGRTLRWELSLPLGSDSEGRISRWSKRIILPPVDLGGSTIDLDVEEETPIEISVQRRP